VVSLQHWRKPPANAPLVQLHVGVCPECVEHGLTLPLVEAPEIELVMIA
jgi:hypothetical protein